jgi:uncharacterized membrane protein YhaH (DUF805 family)
MNNPIDTDKSSVTTHIHTENPNNQEESLLLNNYFVNPIKQFADFKGRSTRKEYWMFVLYSTLISITITIFSVFYPKLEILSSGYSLALFIPSLAIAVRRLHDTNRSGWWILVPFASLVLMCSPSAEKGTTEPTAMSPSLLVRSLLLFIFVTLIFIALAFLISLMIPTRY